MIELWVLIGGGFSLIGLMIWVIHSHLKYHHPEPPRPPHYITIPEGQVVRGRLLKRDGSTYSLSSWVKVRPATVIKHHGKQTSAIFRDSGEIDESGRLVYRQVS